MKGDGPLTADWLQNWSKLLIHESHSILKCEMFWWEITRWLWYYKYSACYILADLLPHIVMTLFQSKLLSYILSCFFFLSHSRSFTNSLSFSFFFSSTSPFLLICIGTISSSCLLIRPIRYQVSLEVQGPHWVCACLCVCVCVCVCGADKVRDIPWRVERSTLIDPLQLPANRNVIYFPRNHFNIKRAGERMKGCVCVCVSVWREW